MEETPLAEEFQRLRMAKRKGMKEQSDAGPSNGSNSGSRWTRSQAAPKWTLQDSFILVNEICAVERECASTLSSYQKWTIVAENCTALDVVRTLDQCRRKWNSLLEEYKVMKGWESKSKGDSYWSLDHQTKKEVGLPLDFDEELYTAIDNLVKIKEERFGTDPDTDPEAEPEVPNTKESGSRKPQNRTTPRKGNTEGKEHVLTGTKSSKKPRRQSNPRKGTTEEKKFVLIENESPKTQCHQSTSHEGIIEENVELLTEGENKSLMMGAEQRKHLLAEKIRDNAELIHAIVAGNLCKDEKDEPSDLNYEESIEMKVARHKADKLISCLADLANNLDLLHNIVDEC